MTEGVTRWTIARLESEQWKLRLDSLHVKRLSSTAEVQLYKTGFIDYWTIDFQFAIFKNSGECISGDLKYKEGKTTSNAIVLGMIHNMKEADFPLLTAEQLDQFLYLDKLYALTNNRMLTIPEYEQFKKMYHAIQREDYGTVIRNLKGDTGRGIPSYAPKRILNSKL